MTSKAFENATDANRQQGGRRNLIINGAQTVNQRNASVTSGNTYVTDRFKIVDSSNFDQRGFTAAQSSVSPDGFSSSLKIDCTTAETTIDANENARVHYIVEAQDAQSLGYGTSSAQSVTLSFYVKSNVTGTYAVSIFQVDGSRIIGSTYTIDSADTWERKTITFAGDTSGTINNDNGAGLQIQWGLTAGSNFTETDNTSWSSYSNAKFLYGQTVNLFSSNTNEWLITGVQLEVGTVATPFEHRSYGEELALCQRYYTVIADGSAKPIGSGALYTGSYLATCIDFPVEMRASPSFEQVTGSNYFTCFHNGYNDPFDSFTGVENTGTNKFFLYKNTQISGTAGNAAWVISNNASAKLAFESEL